MPKLEFYSSYVIGLCVSKGVSGTVYPFEILNSKVELKLRRGYAMEIDVLCLSLLRLTSGSS